MTTPVLKNFLLVLGNRIQVVPYVGAIGKRIALSLRVRVADQFLLGQSYHSEKFLIAQLEETRCS